ncbi:hypothetical protein BJ742DRAFT_740821 [Cladochytrium replicatum]|nr:hypothetical protein BJ742DRAFT_740821 [Cladochytrium replicatum]
MEVEMRRSDGRQTAFGFKLVSTSRTGKHSLLWSDAHSTEAGLREQLQSTQDELLPDYVSLTVGTETSVGPAEPVGMELRVGRGSRRAAVTSIASSTSWMTTFSGAPKSCSGAADSTSMGTASIPKWFPSKQQHLGVPGTSWDLSDLVRSLTDNHWQEDSIQGSRLEDLSALRSSTSSSGSASSERASSSLSANVSENRSATISGIVALSASFEAVRDIAAVSASVESTEELNLVPEFIGKSSHSPRPSSESAATSSSNDTVEALASDIPQDAVTVDAPEESVGPLASSSQERNAASDSMVENVTAPLSGRCAGVSPATEDPTEALSASFSRTSLDVDESSESSTSSGRSSSSEDDDSSTDSNDADGSNGMILTTMMAESSLPQATSSSGSSNHTDTGRNYNVQMVIDEDDDDDEETEEVVRGLIINNLDRNELRGLEC